MSYFIPWKKIDENFVKYIWRETITSMKVKDFRASRVIQDTIINLLYFTNKEVEYQSVE